MTKYPKATMMKLNAWVMIVCWGALVLWGLFTFLTWLSFAVDTYAEILFYLFIVTVGIHVVLATVLTCPNCGKRPTIQIFTIHKKSEKLWGMDGWAVVIIRSAFYGRFRCIHCATDYQL